MKSQSRPGLYILVILGLMSSCATEGRVQQLHKKLCLAPTEISCPK